MEKFESLEEFESFVISNLKHSQKYYDIKRHISDGIIIVDYHSNEFDKVGDGYGRLFFHHYISSDYYINLKNMTYVGKFEGLEDPFGKIYGTKYDVYKKVKSI